MSTRNSLFETNDGSALWFQNVVNLTEELLRMRQEVKLLKDGPRSAIAVAYQTISTSFASRPFDKPHNGRSVCRSRLRVAHDAKGSLDNKPAHHKILRQQWRGHGQRLRHVQV